MSITWNPWHGCKKHSAGCENCYVYRIDGRHDRDAREVKKNKAFNLPVAKNRQGEYKIQSGETIYTCFSSDFLIDTADEWRIEAWEMIRQRSDCTFVFLTKRIERLRAVLPSDWGEGYDNVVIGCTCENQEMADYRLPIFMNLPIKHRIITMEPLLTPINFAQYITAPVEQVIAGGESGLNVRVCDFDWILDIHAQCRDMQIGFYFKQTGAYFKKDGHIYNVRRQFQHSQARKAGLNFYIEKACYLL